MRFVPGTLAERAQDAEEELALLPLGVRAEELNAVGVRGCRRLLAQECRRASARLLRKVVRIGAITAFAERGKGWGEQRDLNP